MIRSDFDLRRGKLQFRRQFYGSDEQVIYVVAAADAADGTNTVAATTTATIAVTTNK